MSTSSRSDKELISSYLAGDSTSFNLLFNRHQKRIYNYIVSRVRNRAVADDILQDTFMKVVKTLHGGKYREEGKFLPWAMRIAHNLVIDHFRLSKKMYFVRSNGEDDEGLDAIDQLKDVEQSIEEILIQTQVHKNLKEVIKLLPEEQREVLEMRHFNGMSFQDIAEETSVSINTALGRMRYALMNVRKIIKDKEDVLLVS